MANLLDIRRRIKSVKNTRQITKAMELVAASKMKKAQQAALAGRPYSQLMASMLAELGPSPPERPHVYVCGPTPFVEAVAEALVQLGHEPQRVKTERFGATGG